MLLGKYSFGIGDRFGHQGKAQLAALAKAQAAGFDVTPVWNKSHREHSIIGTRPGDVRREADEAVAAGGWESPYFVDADHIGMGNVDLFVEASDFFTLDVADFIGQAASETDVDAFVARHRGLIGTLRVEGIAEAFEVSEAELKAIAGTYLAAVKEAGTIYRHIESSKGAGDFVTEVSMDETDAPQTPVEMLVILAAIADEGIPAQTVAPKFSGRFNKGVDYVGDVAGFAREFEQDLAVIAFAVKEFGLPANLKLSVHSGSDKFSIYGPIRKALAKFDAGVHLKTAGTTWLEELIGLASAGGEGLVIAREVYAKALARMDELCGPYATVIDIDTSSLPSAQEVKAWDGETFASTLRHDQSCEKYNPSFRQLLHVGYKVAAEMGPRFLNAWQEYEEIIAKHVTTNIYERHIRPLFLGD
jgi:tagaturonate epimerase